MFCRQIRKLLERNGFHVIIAQHMEEARIILINIETQFDLIILDIMLPINQIGLNCIKAIERKRVDLIKQYNSDYDDDISITNLDRDLMNNLNMRGGIELIKEYRNHRVGTAGRLDIPVLYLTPRYEMSLRKESEELVETELVRWLEKPVRRSIIIENINELLGLS